MKLGITLSTYPSKFGPIVFKEGDVFKDIKTIKKLEYDGVDLFTNRKTDQEIDELKRAFENEGIEIAMYLAIFLAEMGLNLSCSDEEKRKKFVKEYKGQIEIARRIGTKRMSVGLMRGAKGDSESMEACLDRLAKSLGELCSFASNKGIKLCLEPINRYEINTLNSVDSSIEFIEKYSLDELGLLLDAFHMNIEDASIEGSIQKAGKRIEHFHSPDSNRLAAGWGHLDYDSILKALIKENYDGYLTIEAFPKPDALSCAVQSAKYFREKLISIKG